jgi:acyl-CoA synthetase (AMP-forming)/AMP-acid ligase II
VVLAGTGAAGRSLTGRLARLAAERPDDAAYGFLDGELAEVDRLSYRQLAAAVDALGARLGAVHRPGARALLVCRPGLSFVVGFLAARAAGLVVVPAPRPRGSAGRARVAGILTDCAPAVVLADPVTAGELSRPGALPPGSPPVTTVDTRATDTATADTADTRVTDGHEPGGELERPAVIQYTSGSTEDPRGVVLSEANLLANLAAIRDAYRFSAADVVLSWVPQHHDLGLIGGALLPLYLGARGLLMSPAAFAADPLRWPLAMSRYRATASGGPDTAYDLCARSVQPGDPRLAELRLDARRVAVNGGEPVRAATLRRFSTAFGRYGFADSALRPSYGLAEATLHVTGADGPRTAVHGGSQLELVSSGRPAAGTTVEIVSADGQALPDDRVGRIVVRGPGVSGGYWGSAAGASTVDTGDLGLRRDGELYVVGRSSEVIVVRGRNLHPADVEDAALAAHPGLRPGAVVAIGDGELVLLAESTAEIEQVARRVVAAVTARTGVTPARVVLLRRAELPRTTSGKLRRREAARRWAENSLAVLAEWAAPDADDGILRAAGRLDRAALERAVGFRLTAEDWERPVHALGVDSVRAARLAQVLAGLGVRVRVSELLSGLTPAELLARADDPPSKVDPAATVDPADAEAFARIMANR